MQAGERFYWQAISRLRPVKGDCTSTHISTVMAPPRNILNVHIVLHSSKEENCTNGQGLQIALVVSAVRNNEIESQ